jgi:hypothetical protein
VACGFVQQQRHRCQRQQAGVLVECDGLVEHAELRLFNDHAVDADPAAFDVLLGLAARARQHFGQTLGEANGFCHRGGPS